MANNVRKYCVIYVYWFIKEACISQSCRVLRSWKTLNMLKYYTRKPVEDEFYTVRYNVFSLAQQQPLIHQQGEYWKYYT